MSSADESETPATKRRIGPFVENFAEAGAACLFTMVQGNLLTITITHWVIAAETGVAAGVVAGLILLIWRTITPLMIAIMLGVVTTVVDYLIHPPMLGMEWGLEFGAELVEPIVTGLAAGVLSWIIGHAVVWLRRRYWPARDAATSTTGPAGQ